MRSWPGAPRHAGQPGQPRPLYGAGGGSGRGPGRLRRAAADPGAGLGPGASRQADRPGQPRAACTGAAGDPAAARDAYAALLPIRERVSGPEHPDTLTARANLAYWTRQADVR